MLKIIAHFSELFKTILSILTHLVGMNKNLRSSQLPFVPAAKKRSPRNRKNALILHFCFSE